MKNVVVCPEPLAAEAGAEIFRQGGSAIDAALATAFAQAVVSPVMTSIGATGVMNLYHAPTGQSVVLDFHGYAGANATPDMFVGAPPTAHFEGYRSIAIPTFMRATQLAFERYGSGRVSWAAILEPAIRYAEEGYTVYPYNHQYWRAELPVLQGSEPFDGYRMLTQTPACAEIFTTNGRVHAIGERIVQRDLARTLRRLAEAGPEDFYTGEIGRRVAEDLAAHGADVTAEDLANCSVDVLEPVSGTYRGLTLTVDPPPGVGPLLLELLNILEGYDLAAMGLQSAEYFDLMAQALDVVFQDRRKFSFDPKFADVSLDRLISKEYAAEVRSRMHRRVEPAPSGPPAVGTTQVSTYDAEGSGVSVTHSIGIGSGVVTSGLGFIYNNNMHAFDRRPGQPNSIAPGKRPTTGGGPTIVFENGKVRMVLGSPHGARKTSSMGHVLACLIDGGMSPAAAVTSSRIHIEDDPNEIVTELLFPLPAPAAGRLRAAGYRLREHFYGGRVCLIDVDPATGNAAGASDPRGGGGLAEV